MSEEQFVSMMAATIWGGAQGQPAECEGISTDEAVAIAIEILNKTRAQLAKQDEATSYRL